MEPIRLDDQHFHDIQTRVLKFANARDWRQFHSPKNLSMALAGEAGELLELFQWLTEEDSRTLNPERLESVALELADIQIYLIRIAQELNLNLLAAVDRKVAINEHRYPADRVRGSHKKYNEYPPPHE